MKRFFISILIIALLISLCGCKATDPLYGEDSAKVDTYIEKTEPGDSTEDSPQTAPEPEKTTLRYEAEDLKGVPLSKATENVTLSIFYATFSAVKKGLGETGSIIAGRAFGTRESPAPNYFTLTSFTVEKVYWGKDVPSEITVIEPYVLRYDEDNNPRILTYGYECDQLENDLPTLLFIQPSDLSPTTYSICYIPIPLPADHQSYTDEYLAEFLDYFRGDRSAYQYPEVTTSEVIIDGHPITAEYGGTYWPRQDISDEELLRQLEDHLIVQLAAELKIKLWPYEHREYGANDLPTSRITNYRMLSFPPDPVTGYYLR